MSLPFAYAGVRVKKLKPSKSKPKKKRPLRNRGARTLEGIPLPSVRCQICLQTVLIALFDRHMQSWHPPGNEERWRLPSKADSLPNACDFEILPPGSWSVSQIKAHYQSIFEHSPEYRPERIEGILKIRPSPVLILVGKKGSGGHGYCGFQIPGFDPIILEKPVHNNATYIIFEKWEDLVKKSKGELRAAHKGEFRRIYHSHGWLSNVEKTVKGFDK